MFEMITENQAYVKCPGCGEEYLFALTEDEVNGLYRYCKKEILIQDALPKRDRTVRESFATGICPECWNKMCGFKGTISKDGVFELNNATEDTQYPYLVTIPLIEGDDVKIKLFADNNLQALNEAVMSLIGISPIQVCRTLDYLEAVSEGYSNGEMIQLPCEYSVIKQGTIILQLDKESA